MSFSSFCVVSLLAVVAAAHSSTTLCHRCIIPMVKQGIRRVHFLMQPDHGTILACAYSKSDSTNNSVLVTSLIVQAATWQLQPRPVTQPGVCSSCQGARCACLSALGQITQQLHGFPVIAIILILQTTADKHKLANAMVTGLCMKL